MIDCTKAGEHIPVHSNRAFLEEYGDILRADSEEQEVNRSRGLDDRW